MKLSDFALFSVTPVENAPIGAALFCGVINGIGILAGIFLMAFIFGWGFSLGMSMVQP